MFWNIAKPDGNTVCQAKILMTKIYFIYSNALPGY